MQPGPNGQLPPHHLFGCSGNPRCSVPLWTSLPWRLPIACVSLWAAGCVLLGLVCVQAEVSTEPPSLDASPYGSPLPAPGLPMLPLTPSGSRGALTFPSTPGSQPPPPALTCSQPQMALSHPRPPPHLRLLETPALPGAHPSEVPHYPPPLRPTPPAHLAPHTCVLSYLPWLRMLVIASPPPTLLVAQTTSTSPSRFSHTKRGREEGRSRAGVRPYG